MHLDVNGHPLSAAVGRIGEGVSRAEERLRNSFVAPYLRQQGNTIMDREHVKGAADKAKGAIKEGSGKLSGDKDMETEGKLDKVKGSAHNAAGDVKDAARDAADAMKK
jgi:uncharacterized protein YjbJ (UPF0337 family)